MLRLGLCCALITLFVGTTKAAIIFSAPAADPTTDAFDQFFFGGPGTQHNGEDFTDNNGPPGQIFTTPSGSQFTLNAVGMKGRGNGANFTGNWAVRVATVSGATLGTTLLQNTAVTPTGAAVANWAIMNFSGVDQLTLQPNTQYVFQFYTTAGGSFYGFQNSDAAGGPTAYTGGTAVNGNAGSQSFADTTLQLRSTYDRTFFVDLAPVAVPEPGTFAVLGSVALGLIACGVRRRSAI
ncbi:MAG: PEP-CTERM sorting domain-containing protein [Pirellulales bacterium]